jgi:hypothetical protein
MTSAHTQACVGSLEQYTAHRGGGELVPPMHFAGAGLGRPGLYASWGCVAWACLGPDVCVLPTCRTLSNNYLTGTLPPEWSAMTALTRVSVHPGVWCGTMRSQCTMSNLPSVRCMQPVAAGDTGPGVPRAFL